MPPPVVRPPTPIGATRPPITAKLYGASAVYTAFQVLPGPTATVFLSLETVIVFKAARETVMPPSMLEAPWNAAWPPLLTAKGQLVNRESKITTATAFLSGALKMQ